MPKGAVDISLGKGGPTRQVRTILDIHRTRMCLVPRDDDVAVGEVKGDAWCRSRRKIPVRAHLTPDGRGQKESSGKKKERMTFQGCVFLSRDRGRLD